ncbi:MAG TPA: YeeE/YedE thiosulfate transporter family protein [Gemmatimonadaceae bacterium]|nr:YeeE/YedE thiosulfate transporter family protein [Gemmatimonadaceae bacterium]
MTAPSVTLPVAERRSALALPPWAVLGVLFGVLSAASIALFGPIGVSGTYPRLIGAVARRVTPEFAATNPYLVKMGSLVTPETMLVLGLLIGGFLASRVWRGGSGGARPLEAVHARETTPARRYVDAFVGGFLILFGARLAGGCTSGHIISGMTQLAVSSTIFAAAVFAGGMGVAHLMKAWRATS